MRKHLIIVQIAFSLCFMPVKANDVDYGHKNHFALELALLVSGLKERVTKIVHLKSENAAFVYTESQRIKVFSKNACEISWIATAEGFSSEHKETIYLKNIGSYMGKGYFEKGIVSSKTKNIMCSSVTGAPDLKKGEVKTKCVKAFKMPYPTSIKKEDVYEQFAMAYEYCSSHGDW
jgi:hypothetical protein